MGQFPGTQIDYTNASPSGGTSNVRANLDTSTGMEHIGAALSNAGDVAFDFGMKLKAQQNATELSLLEKQREDYGNAALESLRTAWTPEEQSAIRDKYTNDIGSLKASNRHVQDMLDMNTNSHLPQFHRAFDTVGREMQIKKLDTDNKILDAANYGNMNKEAFNIRHDHLFELGGETPEQNKWYKDNFDTNSALYRTEIALGKENTDVARAILKNIQNPDGDQTDKIRKLQSETRQVDKKKADDFLDSIIQTYYDTDKENVSPVEKEQIYSQLEKDIQNNKHLTPIQRAEQITFFRRHTCRDLKLEEKMPVNVLGNEIIDNLTTAEIKGASDDEKLKLAKGLLEKVTSLTGVTPEQKKNLKQLVSSGLKGDLTGFERSSDKAGINKEADDLYKEISTFYHEADVNHIPEEDRNKKAVDYTARLDKMDLPRTTRDAIEKHIAQKNKGTVDIEATNALNQQFWDASLGYGDMSTVKTDADKLFLGGAWGNPAIPNGSAKKAYELFKNKMGSEILKLHAKAIKESIATFKDELGESSTVDREKHTRDFSLALEEELQKEKYKDAMPKQIYEAADGIKVWYRSSQNFSQAENIRDKGLIPVPFAGLPEDKQRETLNYLATKAKGVSWRYGSGVKNWSSGDISKAKEIVGDSKTVTPEHIQKFNEYLVEQNEPHFEGMPKKTSGESNDYDMAGAKAAGIKPDERGHYPDTYKLPNHITFSTNSKYSVGDKIGGEWKQTGKQWDFKASPFNLQQHSKEEMIKYFIEKEPDSKLTFPDGSVLNTPKLTPELKQAVLDAIRKGATAERILQFKELKAIK